MQQNASIVATNPIERHTDQSPLDFTTITVVVAIIIFSGLFAGWAAHQTAVHAPAENTPEPKAMKPYLLLGVVAAACVPLFLRLIQSNLVDNIFEAQGGQPFGQYLVLLGFCLIAGFSARRFIESASRRVLRDLEDVKDQQEAMRQRVVQTERTAQDAQAAAGENREELESLDANAPPPAEARVAADALELAPVGQLSNDDRRALEALAAKTYRTRSGVAEDAGIARHRISEVLESLQERQLAAPTRSPSTGGVRWVITERGREALSPA